MTSDGISQKDWDEIHLLALDVANAIARDDAIADRICTERLFDALNHLEKKYGRLPSILGTRADFAAESRERVALWTEAYFTACEISDFKNRVYIASSLATYFHDAHNPAESLRWLELGEDALRHSPDKDEAKTLRELRIQLSRHKDKP